MSFTEKALTYTLELEGGGGGTITGLRSICTIVNAGPPAQGQASIAIYGMTLQRMNQMTTFGTQVDLVGRNKIRVEAGDVGGPMTLIFEGTIITGYMDGMDQPQVAFRIQALGAAWEAVMPSQTTSTQGAGDFAQLMSQLAQKMNLQFENSLQKPIKIRQEYLHGSYYQQAKELAEHHGVEMTVDRGVLAIWTPGYPRGGKAKASYKDGTLVGYPAFNQAGPIVTMYFNPNLHMGDTLTVESTITAANGDWYVAHIEYDLAALVPNGPWFCTAYCTASQSPEPAGDQG